MERPKHVVLVNYWNYIFSPALALTALFGVYVVSTLRGIQTTNTAYIGEGIRKMRNDSSNKY